MVAKLLEQANVSHPFEVVELLRKNSLELDDGNRANIVGWVSAVSNRQAPPVLETAFCGIYRRSRGRRSVRSTRVAHPA